MSLLDKLILAYESYVVGYALLAAVLITAYDGRE